jgi:cytochrome c-type biogenesis protein CcmH
MHNRLLLRNTVKRGVQLFLIAGLVIVSVGAGDVSGRYDKLSHQIMCTCGCAELLGECNHVGCPDSPGMLNNLKSEVDLGKPDRAILIDFQNQYGPTALAAPRFTAFNHIAWILPPLLLLLGVGLVALVVRRWKLQPATVPSPLQDFSKAEFDRVRERVRRDIEI